jgi:hypothetical protein
MVDVEQQIRAWADAAAPPTGEAIDAADVIGGRVGRAAAAPPVDDAPRRRERWLAVAATVLVVAAVGIGVLVQSDDGAERLEAQHPSTTSTSTSGVTGPGTEVAFDVLAARPNEDGRIGLLRAAQTPAELDGLWSEAGLGEPEGGMNAFRPPEVDFDEQLVVSMTIAGDGCQPELAGFRHEGAAIEPRFIRLQERCGLPLIPQTFVVALDWDTTGDKFLLVLNGLRPQDDQETLEVVRQVDPPEPERTPDVTPEVATATLELDGTEVASGGTLTGTLTVVNDTGAPIEGITCGPYFVGLLGNGHFRQTVGRGWCRDVVTIPEGSSTYDIEVEAVYTACAEPGGRPGGYPTCRADGGPIGLPAGTYELRIDDPQHLVEAIEPVPITVTAR